jgi:hypothetical protein
MTTAKTRRAAGSNWDHDYSETSGQILDLAHRLGKTSYDSLLLRKFSLPLGVSLSLEEFARICTVYRVDSIGLTFMAFGEGGIYCDRSSWGEE